MEPMHLDGDGPPWESVAEDVRACRGGEALLVRPFAGGVPLVERPADVAELRRLVTSAFRPGRPVIDAARAFCHAIHETFEYDRTFTDVSTPLATVLAARRGVCQDFAHLAAGGLRLLGLAARYVSGYIETAPPAGARRLVGADASHAWCSVWVPDVGWVDFDPTNDHLPVAPPHHAGVGSRLQRRAARARRGDRPARPPDALGRRRRSSARDPRWSGA